LDIQWKEELYGIDFINSLEEKEKNTTVRNVRLMIVALKKPKISYEEALALPVNEFMELYVGFVEKYKKSLFRKVSSHVVKKSGLQFVKEEDFVKEKQIEFSTVR